MGRNTGRPLLLPILSAVLSLSAATDTIPPGDSVGDGNFLVSADGRFKLGFFTPAGSKFRYLGIWFNAISVQTVVWVANRDRPLPDSTGVLSLYANGSLVLSDGRGEVYWLTAAVTGLDSPVAMLLNNGNFVMTRSGQRAAASPEDDYPWQSFDYPTDSLLPEMKLGWDLRSGRNRNLTAWRSTDDPAPGEYALVMDTRGDPQLFLVRRTTRMWRTGPWIGQRFSGIPEMPTYKALFRIELVTSADEVYLRFYTLNSSVRSRLVVQPTGVLERVVWNEKDGTWKRFWFAPKDQCESVMMNPCGPFGVCDTNDSPVCSCVRGFNPKSPHDWYLGDGKDGCLRRTALDCRNVTDGFVLVAGAKLPDTSAAVVNQAMGLEECRAACLGNCSCTAYANAEVTVSGSSGCILWGGHLMDLRLYSNGGQDLFVRVAAADVDKPSSRARRSRRWVSVLTVVSAVLGTLVLGWVGCCVWRKTRKRTTVLFGTTTSKNSYRNVKSSRDNDDLDLPLFDFSTIAAATDGFSTENKLGEGGFGPVYKGRLAGGQEVAVKRLARNSVQGVDEFKNEVSLIAKLQHRNLVRLLGCCIQGEEQMLIYEYMPNKSLDAFLFDKRKGPLLDWGRRYHIIQGIARGLLYLHQDSRLRIIHRDLKPSNVLLDEEMNPKISDFGMARMFCGDGTEENTKRVVGTHGYMSPEYITHGVFSVKSDVFSFGVMVLEIVSGKKNRGIFFSDPNLNLLGYAWSLWKAGDWLELVDSSIANSFPMAELLKCVNVGLLCVQERPEDRPTMASVVQLLGNETVSLPQPKQPGFMAMRSPFEVLSLSREKLSSVNEVTITMCDGR